MNNQITDTDRDHAKIAQKILKLDPENALARQVIEEFLEAQRNGKRITGFSGFMLRDPDEHQNSPEADVRGVDD